MLLYTFEEHPAVPYDDTDTYGRCEWCLSKAMDAVGLDITYDDVPPAIFNTTPVATRLYHPPCRCSYGNCWDAWICEGCAEGKADIFDLEDED